MVSSGSTATLVRLFFLSRQGDISSDFFSIITDVFMWSIIEPGIGLTAASIACLRPLFRKFLSSTPQSNAPQTPHRRSRFWNFQFSATHFSSRIYNSMARTRPPPNAVDDLVVSNTNGNYNSHNNRVSSISILPRSIGSEAARMQNRGSDWGMNGSKWVDDSSEEIPTTQPNHKWDIRPKDALDAKGLGNS
jgi:hypothetical protein